MNHTVVIIVKTIIILGVVLALAYFSKKIIKKMGDKRLNELEKKYKTYDRIDIIYAQISSILFYFIIFMGVMFILPLYGIQKETIYGISFSIAIAIGFSAQGPLSNIWYGLIMILGEVYEINDIITINIAAIDKTVIGRIISINLFYTKLIDVNDGREIIISNTLIYNSSVSSNESVIYK
jgi:small-conductance mechanosensitive channel